MRLIGIAGKAGSGKDTVADYLWERHAFTKIAFADPLRKAAAAIFGLDVGHFLDRDRKEVENEYWGLTPRRMLQILGNDALKPYFGDDLWFKRWNLSYQMLSPSDDIVVPDVRFDLEAEAIRHLGGTILHLDRPGAGLTGSAGSHPSEKGVEIKVGDGVLLNDSAKANLFTNLEMLLAALKERDRD